MAQPDPTLPHGHLVLVGPYAPTPITPKENKIIKTKHLLNIHTLHAILGQMNKQKLLFLTFMQNDRGEDRAWV